MRAVSNPDVVAAMVGDYRAGLEVDRFDEEADRAAGRLVRCPTLFAWSARDDMEELYGDPVAVWRPWIDAPLSARPDRLRPPHGRGGARAARACEPARSRLPLPRA